MKKIAYKQMYENELDHAWYRSTRKLLISCLKERLKKDARILDAGCGTGGTMNILKKEGFTNIEGFDYNPQAISFCKKRGLANVKLGSVNHIGYEDNSFDAVICLDVLCQKGVIKAKALLEIHRVLKPGGLFYSQEPAYDWLRSTHDKVVETDHRFTKGELIRNFKKTGFKIIKTSYYNLFFLLPIIIKRIKDKVATQKHISSDVDKLNPSLNFFMQQAMDFEGVLLKRLSLPAGLSVICIAKK